ncbi:MAG: hypothetical protein ABW250_27060 [Pyrinomonadaceae bacterium]
MSNKSSLRFLVVILTAAFATAALVLVDAGVRAQNTNSSTTPEAGAENTNANTAAPRRGRRRGRRRAAPAATAPDATAPDAGTATDTGAAADTGTATAADAGGQDDMRPGDLSGERVDLSGTYTGRVTMTGGHDMSGDGTLTITGNTFTLAVDTMTHTGRVYAVTTRGYIGAAFYFPDIIDTTSNTPVVANVHARKKGESLTLTPAPGTRARLTLKPGRR